MLQSEKDQSGLSSPRGTTGADSSEFQRLMADSIPGFFSPKVTCLSLID